MAVKTPRKALSWILICILVLLISSSCSTSEDKSIAVSIAPVKSLTKAIAGDSWNVTSLVPAGQNPENYEPSIEDMMHLEDARAILHLSLPAEKTTLDKIQSNNPDKLLVDLSTQCAKIQEPLYITDTQLDPHIWLSPKRALLLSEIILDTMISIDPDKAEYYKKNHDELAIELSNLDKAWSSAMIDSSKKTFLIYHPALSYLAHDYGLEMISVEQHGKEPDFRDLDRTIRLAADNEIDTVFYQREFPQEKAEAIAREIDADTVPLSLLEEDYLDMMYELLNVFQNTL